MQFGVNNKLVMIDVEYEQNFNNCCSRLPGRLFRLRARRIWADVTSQYDPVIRRAALFCNFFRYWLRHLVLRTSRLRRLESSHSFRLLRSWVIEWLIYDLFVSKKKRNKRSFQETRRGATAKGIFNNWAREAKCFATKVLLWMSKIIQNSSDSRVLTIVRL